MTKTLRDDSPPDDGSARWAEDRAVEMIAVALYRAHEQQDALRAAKMLSHLSQFCLRQIFNTPRLRAAYVGAAPEALA